MRGVFALKCYLVIAGARSLSYNIKLNKSLMSQFVLVSSPVLPYLAIYREFGYFWHHLANKIFCLQTCPFWLLLKIWLKTGFKPFLNWFWLFLFVLWCRYFCLLKDLWCRYFGFSQVLWCRSFGVCKIWLLFAHTFWQHCKSRKLDRQKKASIRDINKWRHANAHIFDPISRDVTKLTTLRLVTSLMNAPQK